MKLAVKDELIKLAKVKRLYHDKDIRGRSKLTPSQQRRYNYIGGKYRALSERFTESILQCGRGAACYTFREAKNYGFNPQDRPTDFDAIWVPWLRKWFCLKCFVLNQLGEMTHEDFDDPMYREWVKEEFGI
ncbi:MAG: hypothetical protein ACW99F_10845 [Candidatus Hodarchaeales archaeon]